MEWLRGPSSDEERDAPVIGFNEWVQLVSGSFGWNGVQFSTSDSPQEQMAGTYGQLGSLAYQQNGIVFACMAVRQGLFRQMRFQRRRSDGSTFNGPTAKLDPLKQPWPGGTTSDLLARAITHHDLGGNAFFVKTRGGGMALLRPDWVDLVIGSNAADASDVAWDPDAQVVGYAYHPGGRQSGHRTIHYLSDEVAHWAMYPDPLAQFRGMSWLTPIVREIQSDKAASEHKQKFFENSATPQMVVKVDAPSLSDYEQYVELFKRQKEGVGNAYSTLFTARGVDATVVGKDMAQMDFKNVQGAGEVRIAAAAQTPPVIVGLSEGLSGSSLNTGNFQAARRLLVDGFGSQAWGNLCGTLDWLFPPQEATGGRLWPDLSEVAFMKEDQQDAAVIQSTKAETLSKLIAGGYTPESAVKTVVADDFSLLEHTGLYSVQLQPPGSGNAEDAVGPGDDLPAPSGATPVKPAPSGANGRSHDLVDYALYELLRDAEREKNAQPTHIHVTTPPTTVEIAEGAIRSDVRLELPAGEASRTEFAEGAFQTHVSVEPSPTSVSVEPSSITVEPVSVNVEPADVRMEIAPGAVQTDITVEPAEVTVPVSVEPARTEIAEGAVRVSVEMPDVQVDVQPADVRSIIEEGAIQMTVEPADVSVEIETPKMDVNIEARAGDNPAPVVNVNPTPVEITNEVTLQSPDKIVTFDRDADGNIIQATSEDADPEETV